MVIHHLLFASWNFTRAPSFSAGVGTFVTNRSLLLTIISEYWESFLAWISSPHVYAIIIAWTITFTLVTFLILSLGFGPAGVAVGSLMAAFQGWMYGGFTPAGGIFATLTSLGMLGFLAPAAAAISALVATGVALTVWAYGVGR